MTPEPVHRPRAADWPLWKRLAVMFFGWIFVVLGVLGTFLPFLQGILFLVIGLSMLATVHVWAHNLSLWLRRRFPPLDRVHNYAERKMADWRHAGTRTLRSWRVRLGLSR